jgi:hypothetical protein
VKVVGFRQSLAGGRGPEELHVLGGVVLTEGEFVDFLLAAENVGVTLEEALLDVVVDGQANGFDLHPNLATPYAFSL